MTSTKNQPVPSAWTGRRAAGFSLVEVLIAMGIFAVGFVAVAAMFPAGAILQRETVADVESQMVARNATALVRTHRVTFKAKGPADLTETSGSGVLEPVTLMAGASAKLTNGWKLGDRGYPTAQQTTQDRKYYWLPMIRRTKTPATKFNWVFVVFVLRRDASANYSFPAGPTSPVGTWANSADGPTIPKVIGVAAAAANGRFTFTNRLYPETAAGTPDQVRVGDFVADQDGVVYNVTAADATGITIAGSMTANPTATLWYAPPPQAGASSPCTRVLLISGVVEEVN